MCDLASATSNQSQKFTKLLTDYKQIILELRAQNFDVIRFATYRTASKLRFIQKRLNLHLIDLWNVIETFRDTNLHTLDLLHELDSSKLEQCIQNMYLQLNKRLAFNQQINVDSQTQLLLSWMLNLYDKNRLSRLKVFSFKIALTTMCSGKLVDKLKYIFNQICDQSKNTLLFQKFDLYLKELLVLPKSVFEEPSFGYTENSAKACFDWTSPINLEDFLSVALSDAGPPSFIWLNIFHRFIVVQNVQHSVKCCACERSNFNGFRYKCQKCRKYQLCQDCFWRGRISHSHQLTHQMKEYTSYKSAAKQFSNSLKRSFFCKPNKNPANQKSNQNAPKTYQNVQFNSSSSQYNTLGPSNAMTTSDYSLLNKNSSNKDKMFQSLSLESSKFQTESKNMPNANSVPINRSDLYSNPQNKNQYSFNLINTFLDSKFNQSSDINNLMNELSIKPTHSVGQFNQTSNRTNYSNTFSMLKTRNNDTSTSNYGNFYQKSLPLSHVTIDGNQNLDEHHIIQVYSARLAEIYSKNPHLTQLPPSTQSPRSNYSNYAALAKSFPKSTSIKSIKHNTFKQKLNLLNESRTASLSRQMSVSPSQRFNAYNTSRSLSENNFRHSRDSLGELEADSEDTDLENLSNYQLLKEKQEIVAKLERQNKEILKEIKRLRLKQLSNCSLDMVEPNEAKYKAPMSATLNRKVYNQDPILLELQTLKHKKGQLESRMQILESNRNELLNRLSQLDALINRPANSINKNRNGIITNLQPRSWSSPSSPAMNEIHPPRAKFNNPTSLNQSTNSSMNSLNEHNSTLHNDLLLAADSVTSAMQNLVKELNSENDDFGLYSAKNSKFTTTNTPNVLRENLKQQEETKPSLENVLYQNSLISESFIDDLTEKQTETMEDKKTTIVDELLSNLVDNTELGESWRKELEQILVDNGQPSAVSEKNNEFNDLL
ncbi:dystrobrevin beta-like isoform X1 [Brachionus plicatilis]|uniref:Dystrobrevin beta-like isoform X1 n=1 Tax=Brachionus plicatilis TaxID=10195 RepID=A0A3M7QKB7_BRAPC|nr:dystrobrevin beta-like isoform X1 [Brachionus plicatilis]